MNYSHLPVGTKKTMLTVGACCGINRLFCRRKYGFPVIGMDHFTHKRNVKGVPLSNQPKDAVRLLRPNHLIRLQIPYPVAQVSDTLGFFEPILAFLQIARQGVTRLFRLFQFRYVLNGAEKSVVLSGNPILPSHNRRLPELRGNGLNGTHFSIRADDPMLVNGMYADSNLLVYCAIKSVAVIGVDEAANRFNVHRAFLWVEPEYSIGLVGPDDLARLKIPIPIADVGNTLSFFKSSFAFLKAPGQCLTLVIGSFAFGDVCYYTCIFEVAGVISSSMCDYMNMLDDPVRQENSVFNIQVHAVLSGTIPELLQAVPVLRVNSVEYQIKRRIGFSCKTQNFVGFVRPNEFTALHFPSESPRVTQPLRLCKVLPSSLQIGLQSFQIFIRFFKCGCSLSVPILRTLTRFGKKSSISAPAN